MPEAAIYKDTCSVLPQHNIWLIDEDAVQKLRNARIAEKTRADKAERELGNLRSAHENLSLQWNALWKEPEFNEAARKVKERKEREARLAAEAKFVYCQRSRVSRICHRQLLRLR